MDMMLLSENGLRSLHEAIRLALDDDNSREHSSRRFHVRETQDWSTWRDALEDEFGASWTRIRYNCLVNALVVFAE